MSLIKLLWKRFTLLCILALTALPLMIIGWSGRNTIYGEYILDPIRQPGLTLVFEGIHDGVYPWQGLIKPKADAQEEAEEGAAADSSAVGETASAGTSAQARSTDAAGSTAVTGSAAETGSTAETKETKKEEPGDASAQYTEAEDASVYEMKTLPANAISGSLDEIPEGVCNPVMQAADYDVVDVGFLSPDDTEYNTDTEGIFAKNGIYYKLGLVDSTYFSDALFIGDSRTVGLCEYGSLKGNAAFLAKESVNVYNVLDQELRYTDHDGESWSAYVEEILSENKYGKVYVALGVNELGIGTTYMYYEKYREILSMIREYQPDALIYIQGIMHVSYDKSSTDSCRNNTVISQRNMAISTLANGRDIFYIDMNPYVCDEDGDLYEDLSGDGIHLKASAYENWDRFLMENAIVTGE